jgi:hypothetical protein
MRTTWSLLKPIEPQKGTVTALKQHGAAAPAHAFMSSDMSGRLIPSKRNLLGKTRVAQSLDETV